MSDKDKYRKLKKEDLFDYAEDRLSESQRHAIERQFQKDPFDADAAEGFEQVSREEAEADLAGASRYIRRRIGRRRRMAWYSAAAVVASLLIVSTIYFNVDTGDRSAERVDKMSEAAEHMSDPLPGSGGEDLQPEEGVEELQPEEGVEELQPEAGLGELPAEEGALEERDVRMEGLSDETVGEDRAAEEAVLEETVWSEAAARDEVVRDEVPARKEGRDQADAPVRDDAPVEGEIYLEDDTPAKKKDDLYGDLSGREYQKAAAPEPDRSRLLMSRVSETGAVSGSETAMVKGVPVRGTDAAPGQYLVSGVVVSMEDSMPIPGATVLVKGTTIGTVTGYDGEFELPVPEGEEVVLAANFIGMESAEVNVAPDQPVNIAMNPSVQSLDEVVVVGYGISSKQELTGAATGAVSDVDIDPASESVYQEALPVGGLQAFKSYVESSLVFPDTAYSRNRAVVVLKFMVSPGGRPADIHPVRSPGTLFTKEAIRVLEEGPDWNRATMNGQPTDGVVRIRMVFRKGEE